MEDIIHSPLARKKISFNFPYQERVLFFDPKEVYERISFSPYNRHPSPEMIKMFPQTDKTVCACGCGEKLTGRRTRWANKECSDFAIAIFCIIDARLYTLTFYLEKYYGWKCFKCDETKDLKIDHIIPVKHGGGGCWLSNYQLLCHKHHVEKTNEDFGWKAKEKVLKNQLQIF